MNSFSRIRCRRSAGRRFAGVSLSIVLAAGLAACDDFIATEPLGQLTTENFFETEQHAIQATNATYSMLRDWAVHVFAWVGMTDIASDDATKGSVPADAAFLLDLDNLLFDPGNIAFSTTWGGYYQGVYRANFALQNIPNVTMDETLKARLIAENKFLRAYFYFFLVRAYGGVPLLTAPLPAGEFEQPRATAEEVYALIEQDLTDAIAALPERSEYSATDVGRATRGAARALLAKVHLTQGEFPEALARAQEVINSGQYSLFSDYDDLFSRAGENSSESVFEVQTVALEQEGAGSQYAQVQGVRGTPNIGWGFNTASAELEAAFENGDPRLHATIMYPWEMIPDGTGRVVYLNPSMPNNRYNQKVFISPETPGGSGNGGVNIRRIRYADVLLMAAEAAARQGMSGEAQSYLNQVRARARAGRTVTLGFAHEALAGSIASDVLGLGPTDGRVFARYVKEGTPAFDAGLRSFTAVCSEGACGSADVPPVRVTNAHIIQQLDGIPVNSIDSFQDVLSTKAPGSTVAVQVLEVAQNESGNVSTETFTANITVQALLPDVTVGGDDLVEAIWQERRVELAMEQHRWFDIIRQGRAAELLAAHGKTFQPGRHELFPIPSGEVEIAGLQQNPGY